MKQTLKLLRDKAGLPKRFAIRCNYEDKERVKKAGSGSARWSKTDKLWTIPPDPVLLGRMMSMFPDADIEPDLQEYLEERYRRQREIYMSTSIHDPISPDCKLFPYQNSSVRVLDSSGSLILGHDMGLGKTPIVCCALDYVAAKRVLIVCPSSVKWSWVDHLIEWAGRTDIYVVESSKLNSDVATVISGKEETRNKALSALFTETDQSIVLMSYDMMRIHQTELMKFDYDVIVFDEAHRLKNRKAQVTQAAMGLCESCNMRWLLSGTPIRNHYTDIYTLLSMVDPVRFTSYWNFVSTYLESVPNIFGGTDIVGLKDEEVFNSMLSVYMYRLTKAEVLDQLPPKIYTDIPLPMKPKQEEIYRQMEDKMLADMGDEIVLAPTVLTQLIRLRQICLNPAIIGGPDESAKLEVLYDLLKDLLDNDQKVLIFSYFRQFLKYVEEMLNHIGVPFGLIVGGQPSRERYEVQNLLTSGAFPVVVGTAQSMGESMNLQAADTAIFCDIDWVPANNIQAEDRIHRGAIKTSPNIIRLRHPNTVESDIWATCRRKEEVTDKSIGSIETIRNMILRREGN